MPTYEFVVTMVGKGEDAGAAWDDAWEKFSAEDKWKHLPEYWLVVPEVDYGQEPKEL
jgi:hypothetical protein